jgi:hypothetical protein
MLPTHTYFDALMEAQNQYDPRYDSENTPGAIGVVGSAE